MAKRALEPLKKYRAKVILAPIFKMFECVCELLVPLLVKKIIDYLTTSTSYELNEILYPFLIMFGLAILGFGITMITQYLAAKVSSDYGYDLKKELYGKLGELSEKEVEDFGKSKVLTMINNDSFSLQTGVNMFMRLLVRAPFLIVGTIVASFLLSVPAGLVTLGVLLLSSFIVFLVMKLSPKKYREIQSELDHISEMGEDNLTGARVIRAFSKEKEEQERFEKISASYEKKAFSLDKLNALLNPLTFLFVNLGVIIVIYLSGYHADGSGISVGTAVALITYFAQALAVLIMFSRLIFSLSKATASKRRVDEFLSIEPSLKDGSLKAEPFEKGETIFEIRGASLTYGGESLAIEKLDFELRCGEKIGIIGPTGSGKSSIISLLERFADPVEGEVLLGNKPLKDYSLSEIRKNIALVSQKPQLYRGTIRENILLGNELASEEEIQKALDDSLSSEFVNSFEKGLDHFIDEGGVNLSGGQRQRLLIARALLSKRPILILDDATSALDYKSDSEVRKNLSKREISQIIISERATSIMGCDRIYVMDSGRLVARGTHEELMSSCSLYREIYEMQVAVK